MTTALAIGAVALLLLAGGGGFSPVAAQEEFGDLPPGKGQEEVFYNCTACHSTKIITQQGMTRKRWEDALVWMVEEQGMPELDEETLNVILDYLAEQFGPDRPNYEVPSPYRQLQPLTPPGF